MGTMNSELYRALIAAGVTDDMATKAAESMASYDARFSKLDADMAILKWVTGASLAVSSAVLALLGKLILHV